MEKKMSVMGVGVKIAIPVLLWSIAMEGISILCNPRFTIAQNFKPLLLIGIVLIVVGFSLNLVAAFSMLKANKRSMLATGGLYAIFRDPMYVLQIYVTLPGLFLLFNSWLLITGVIPAYLAYRKFVPEEHKYLECRFGEAYRQYLDKVPVKI